MISEPVTNIDLRLGMVLDGKYRLIKPIAAGGMGSVWQAEHLQLGHTVAVKLLRSATAANPNLRSRFEQEARLAARLGDDCENIAQVNDIGVADDGTPYVVMDLLRGEDLETRLKREDRLPPALALDIVRQLCVALRTAHAAGIIHRDLKPANVFLTKNIEGGGDEDGRKEELIVKLLDFGCAKNSAEDTLLLLKEGGEGGAGGAKCPSLAGYVLGSPAYMSPEQIRGGGSDPDGDPADRVDASTDLWAAAALIYRMLVGREPFEAEELRDLALRIQFSPFTPPSKVDPSLPRGLDAFMKKALAKSREERFKHADELCYALEKALVSTTPANADVDDEALETLAGKTLPLRRNVWPVVVGVTSIAITAAVFGARYTVAGGGSPSSSPRKESTETAPTTTADPAPIAAINSNEPIEIFPTTITSTVVAPQQRNTNTTTPNTNLKRPAPTPTATSSHKTLEKKATESWKDRGQM